MSNRRRKIVNPKVLEIILLDELCGRLEEMNVKLDRLGSFNKFMGPMNRRFKRPQQYQYATINAGQNGRVWYMKNPQPELLRGIITAVGNSWFEDTYLEFKIDYEPQRIDYEIGTVNEPKQYTRGIPFGAEVEWTAYNNSDVDHVFEVLCNGFYIPIKNYEQIVGS